MANLALRDLSKTYDKTEVLHSINLEVKDGEFIVFVGPSGCGKSTTLRMIAGLEEVTSGTVEIGGRVVNNLEPKDRDIAMVFQNYVLYPHLTVKENMAFSLRLRKQKRKMVDERVNNAA
ncbi:MAG: ATP-binding cassette domain-containing protein, partial [Roseicyclus sp.]|nr:ATP-binding cassette domain-containing protein [Roseicyclus sp.]